MGGTFANRHSKDFSSFCKVHRSDLELSIHDPEFRNCELFIRDNFNGFLVDLVNSFKSIFIFSLFKVISYFLKYCIRNPNPNVPFPIFFWRSLRRYLADSSFIRFSNLS